MRKIGYKAADAVRQGLLLHISFAPDPPSIVRCPKAVSPICLVDIVVLTEHVASRDILPTPSLPKPSAAIPKP